jgi:hypothetical protein
VGLPGGVVVGGFAVVAVASGSGPTEAHERTDRQATVWWEMVLAVAAVVGHRCLGCWWYIHPMRGPSRTSFEMRLLRDLGWEAAASAPGIWGTGLPWCWWSGFRPLVESLFVPSWWEDV